MKSRFILIVFIIISFGCKKGEKVGNTPPETTVFLDRIDLSGSDRLNSVVQLHWSGEDKDGIVTRFEFSFNEIDWISTEKNDSIFRFDIPEGADSSDVLFYVRAIDDQEAKDPTPAFLKIPIRNTKPVIAFDLDYYPKDTIYPVVTLLWNASDIDGQETLDSIYLKVNNGNWVQMPASVQQVTIIPQQPKNSGNQEAKVYILTSKSPISVNLSDIVVNGNNVFYLKVKDKGGLFSNVDTSKTFFITKQNSDLLVVDGSSTNPRAILTYDPILNNLYGGYDYLDITIPSNFPNFTITLEWWFSLHKEIFWFAQGSTAQLDYLDKSESVIQNSLNNGRKMIFSVPIPKTLSPTSSIYRFSPIDSLTVDKDAFMLANGKAIPDPVNAQNYPTLQNTGPGLITQISPFYPKASAQVIYKAELTKSSSEWTDSTNVVARLLNAQGKTNVIFSVIPLEKLNGLNNLQQVFQAIKDEFNW